MTAPAPAAVFLSYASEDTEAARRICDGLRAAGLEVWFDLSELRGGESWDKKIRTQIRRCALFLPIISASTEARLEGYFRLEWKLAEDRSHLMAKDKPFLVPVVIDATRDRDAHVPEAFLAVQWTHLPGGEVNAAFCEQIRRLLGASAPPPNRPRPVEPAATAAGPTPLKAGRRVPVALWSLTSIVALAVAGYFIFHRTAPSSASTKQKTATPAPTAAASAPSATAPEKSLVVLPLENLSPDPEYTFFADGMHEEIISTLARIPDLKVISRESAVALKSIPGSLAERAGKVGVANVITGSVRRDTRSIRVHLELRRARDEALLWHQTYDKPIGEGPLGLQVAIADQVARALQARNARGNYAGAQFMTKDPRAYDLFLKTQHSHYQDQSVTARQRHTADLETVLQLDPGYSTAMRLLVTIHLQLSRSIELDFPTRLRHQQEARRWAETVARVAPGGGGDEALANYYSNVERDNPRALAYAENAVRLLPNDATAHNRHGNILRSLGRMQDSVSAYRQALALDPLNPVFRLNLLSTLSELRWTDEFNRTFAAIGAPRLSERLFASRFRLTGELPDSIESLSSDYQLRWLWLARRFAELIACVDRLAGSEQSAEQRWQRQLTKVDALRWSKREPEARAVATELGALMQTANAGEDFDPSYRDWRLAATMARLDRAEEALPAARRYVDARSATADAGSRWFREIRFAELCALLNRPRECAELLARLLAVPSGLTVPVLKIDPTWDRVRDDPAFQALLADPKNSAPL